MNQQEIAEKWLTYVDVMLERNISSVLEEPQTFLYKTDNRKLGLRRFDLEQDLGLNVDIVKFNDSFYVVEK